MSNYKIEAVKALAQEIKADGFRVFIAKSGTYGFYTDADGSRLVSFQLDLGGFNFTGNYKTDQPRSTGTGWQLVQNRTYKEMFNECPTWSLRGASWKFTTLAQHLATYQASSVYTEVLTELETVPAKDENGKYAEPVSIGTIHRAKHQ